MSNSKMTIPETIVVVDDVADAAAVLAEALTYEGYEVCTAADGVIALDLIAQHMPMCVLMDVDMPRMNGFELAGRLRELYASDIVLIAVTGWGSDNDRVSSQFDCFDHCLRKPVSLDKLRAILRPG